MDAIIDAITGASTIQLIIVTGLLSFFVLAILMIDLLYNGMGKLSVLTKVLMLITTFLMCSYILISTSQMMSHTDYVKGTVVEYQYQNDKSKMVLEDDENHQKTYQVSGMANQFKYQKGDYIHVSQSEGLIFNVEKINDTVYDPPFAKYHAVFIILSLTSIMTLAYVILTLYFKSHQHGHRHQTLKETIHVIFAITTLGLLSLFMVIVMFLSSTDTRTMHLQGKVVDSQLRLDNTKTYVVKEDKTNIEYIVNDKQKRKGHVDLEISKPSHNVTQVISK